MPRFAIDDRIAAQVEKEQEMKEKESRGEKEIEHNYHEFLGMVNEKYGQNSAITIEYMPNLDNIDEIDWHDLPRDWKQIKDSYKIHKCVKLTAELESRMKLMRNNIGMHRLYEKSRVNFCKTKWKDHITHRTK